MHNIFTSPELLLSGIIFGLSIGSIFFLMAIGLSLSFFGVGFLS